MKILIVEDNLQMRRMLRLWLENAANEIEECEDGFDALDCYKKFMPDWVLMDWEMKQMDGLTATREIIADFPQARIVLVTMHDKAGLRTAAREAGVCEFVLKENLSDLRRYLTVNGAKV